jgi:hypothetical protein
MTTAATSSLGKAREHLAAMLAASATFRAWVGATGDDEAAKSAAAAESIWYESLPLPEAGITYSAAEIAKYWPYALIATEDYAARRVANATYEDGGVFLVQLVGLADDAGNDPNETTVLFENTAAQIVEELAGMSEEAGYLEIADLRIVGGPVRAQPEDIAAGGRDEMTLNVRIQWGA